MTSRWIVAGCRGQLGHALGRRLALDPSRQVLASVDLPEVDLADAASIEKLFDRFASRPPEVLVNAAAFTQVDRCEREPEAARRGNVTAPGLLARACADRGIHMVHVSTDYVFAGDSQTPYSERDTPAPRSVYGRTKLEGEERVMAASPDFLTVRTSWVFGRGRNFVAAILDQAAAAAGAGRSALRVVDDQHGRPTYAHDLAGAILDLVELGASGLYHVANRGVASWWEVARLALDLAGYADLSIDRIRTDELQLDAPRPAWSVLDCGKAEALGVTMRSWQEAIGAYLASGDSPILPPGDDE